MFQASKLLLLSSLALPLITANKKSLDITSLEVIEQNDGVVITGKYKVINPSYDSARETITIQMGEDPTKLKSKVIMEMTAGGEFSTDVIPYSNITSIATFTFIIEPLTSQYEKVSQSIKYNPRQNANKYLTISEKENNVPISTNYYKENFDIDESKIKTSYQTFTSLNFEDNKMYEVYKYFDPSYFNFKYENGSDNEFKGNFIFSFYDSYDLFKNFTTRAGSMFKEIPLEVHKVNDIYHFTFKNKLYYEPNTRLMSCTPIEGYIETSYLYLPIGYEDKLKDIRCQLSLDVEDEFSFNIKAEFKVSYIKKYFGDCSDSEYCIMSQDDTNENVYEKVVDIAL